MRKINVGIIGCGNISGIYLTNLTTIFSDVVNVKGVCDLIPERAQYAQDTYGIPVIYPKDIDVCNDPEIDIVLNLTTPPDHAGINLMALNAGKNVYCEKPLAIKREDGFKIKELAKKKGLLAGGAPDTYLGGGIQTCRKLIDEGVIGRPVAATAFMTCHGHEGWHPDPEFYYMVGGGPMFDMGPYYLTALINLLGPVSSVAGSAAISFPQRTITSEKKYGQKIDVEVPTHVAGLLNFESGAIGTIITSFDVWQAELPRIEIYGSEGTLSVPDPNTFGGPIKVYSAQTKEWKEIEPCYPYTENSRGLGVADMARAILEGRKPRNDVSMTFHVLDIMQGFHDSAREGVIYRLNSRCERPAALHE